jgi:hypothetical protein
MMGQQVDATDALVIQPIASRYTDYAILAPIYNFKLVKMRI